MIRFDKKCAGGCGNETNSLRGFCPGCENTLKEQQPDLWGTLDFHLRNNNPKAFKKTLELSSHLLPGIRAGNAELQEGLKLLGRPSGANLEHAGVMPVPAAHEIQQGDS